MPPRLEMVKVPPSISATRDFFLAGLQGKLRQLDREFDNIFFIHVADDGDEQAAIRVGGDADIDVLLIDDFFLLHVDGGVELGEDFEGGGADFEGDGGDGHFAAGLFGLGSEAGAQLFEFGDIGAVVLGDVRNGVP